MLTLRGFFCRILKIAMLAPVLGGLVAGCSKGASDITPTYVSPAQYSAYTCEQLRNEMVRINGQANQLGGKLDKDKETDQGVVAAGIILFWPALFFTGGTKEQEAQYGRLRGEYIALEQQTNLKNCNSPKN